MTTHFGAVAANSVLPIFFAAYNSAGASVTITNFAVGDVVVYKGVSTTQRSSTNGYTLADTDGIDFDSVTGLHGFSIDTSDNTDAGFYAAGSFYTVVVSVVTIDSQTVTLIAATFRIGPDAVNVTQIAGSTVSTSSAQLGVNVVSMAANTLTASALATDAVTEIQAAVAAGAVASVTGAVGSVTGAVGSVTGAVGSVTGDVGGNVTGSVGSLATQAKSDVNAEVVDALNVDTYAQPGQGTPAATTTIRLMLAYLYKAWRNASSTTATQYSLLNDDASTVDQKATLSTSATEVDRGEVATGP